MMICVKKSPEPGSAYTNISFKFDAGALIALQGLHR